MPRERIQRCAVSIHAPRVRGDRGACAGDDSILRFNSRPSCEGRPWQKLKFCQIFGAVNIEKHYYYTKDYELQISKTNVFCLYPLLDAANIGKTSANLLEKSCELEVRSGGSR